MQSALRLIGKIDDTFPGTQSLIVGGAVRDFLMGSLSHDVDIATNVQFSDLSLLFELQDITKNTTHAQPVSVIKYEGFAFEIAQFRLDSVGTDRKTNVSTPVQTFDEDSSRRDITINAMGIDRDFIIIDPQGGRKDLIDCIINCVGDPNVRFVEDATRILRVIRFAAKFNFDISPNTAAAIFNNAHLLLDRSRISVESIGKEIFKAAGDGQSFARFIKLLDAFNLSEILLPEWTTLSGFTHNPKHHPEGGSRVQGHILECLIQGDFKDAVTNLAIFFHDFGKAITRSIKDDGHSSYHGHERAGVAIVKNIFDRLRFNDLSSRDKDIILYATEFHMHIHNLYKLNIKSLTKLVLSPGWELLKRVGFADEASRGSTLFDAAEFDKKILYAEQRVKNIATNRDELRLRVKHYVDGNKLLEWFPELQNNRKALSPLLDFLAEYILDCFDNNKQLSTDDIYQVAANKLQFII